MKQCTKCKEIKENKLFAKNTSAKDGLQQWCKSCQKARREYYRNSIKPNLETLICSKCNIEYSISNFSKNSTSPIGYYPWCKSCKKEYESLDKDRHKRRRQKRISWVRQLKSDIPCLDCGEIYEPECMDYDHVIGDKIKPVSRMVLDNTSKKVILEEIEKCELVCVLCHNIRTDSRLPPRTNNRKGRKRNIQIINDAKNKECCICGESREACNMQFDHIDPTTKFKNISQLKNFKTETLLTELEKCQVICALCHRRKSLTEQISGLYPKARHQIKNIIFIDLESKQKECVKCNDILSFDNFNVKSDMKYGLQSWCKDCINEYRRNNKNVQSI